MPTQGEKLTARLGVENNHALFHMNSSIIEREKSLMISFISSMNNLPRFQFEDDLLNTFHPRRFIKLETDHLTEAAKLWRDLRRSGVSTSDPKALDGDAILAAQVLSLNLPAGEFVVVTCNPDRITRFGLPVEEWENIAV